QCANPLIAGGESSNRGWPQPGAVNLSGRSQTLSDSGAGSRWASRSTGTKLSLLNETGPPRPEALSCEVTSLRKTNDVGGLRALGALLDAHLNTVALVQATVAAGPLDGAVVDENVLTTIVGGDETVALFGVEPLDDPGNAVCHG